MEGFLGWMSKKTPRPDFYITFSISAQHSGQKGRVLSRQPWLPPPCPVLIGRFELQGSLRRKYTEVGLKPQLSPRGVATREEELKSFLAIAD